MARPKNMVIVMDGKVVSMKPSALKGLLTALSSGGDSNTFAGTVVAELATKSDVSGMTPDTARTLLAQLFPTPPQE